MIKIGVVGAGYWGKNLIRNFNNLKALTAICDNDENILNSYQKTEYTHIEFFNNFKDFINSDIDAVVISTPAPTHGKLVDLSINNGKHIFVEKPLCLDVKEALKLKQKAHLKNIKIMVGHLLQYHPSFESLLKFIKKGKIGNLKYIYSNRLSLGKIRKEENALWSFGPHDVSMILEIVGFLPTEVFAKGSNYLGNGIVDTALSFLKFKNNVNSHIFISWLHPFKDQRLIVIGDKGMIAFNDKKIKDKKLLYFAHKTQWKNNIPEINEAKAIPIEYDNEEPLKRECSAFIDYVYNNIEPRTNIDEGIRVLRVLNALQKSINNEKTIFIK
tara:strand:+ start:235 stop:1218 length:984 start_codon:yes stop_codon:yes gene_type:complete